MTIVVYFDQHFGNKTLDQRLGANSIKPILFSIFLQICYLLRFFSFLAQKALKMTIMTSVWGAQHPNASQNIQQTILL